MYVLAQFGDAAPGAIKDWLIILGGALGLVLLVKQIFVRSPSIESEFVTKAEHQKDMDTIKKDVDSIRGKLDRDAEKILAKLEENKDELLLDGHNRSSNLYKHIKDLTGEIFTRLIDSDKQIAALNERTKP